MNRAANAPTWVVVALALLVVAITAVVAGHRHSMSDPMSVPAASAGAADLHAVTPDPVVRRDTASRSFDRTRSRAAEQPVKRTVPLVRKPIPTLPIADRDAAATVSSAEASTYNTPGQCLGWSREQADIPSRYDSAATSWEHATGRHPGDLDPPKGAAVYWLGGSYGYGHVAISLGNGMVRSSDAGGSGVVATVPLTWITREWSLTYAGWSNSINGYTIPGVAGV